MNLVLILASNCITFLSIVVCFNTLKNFCFLSVNDLESIYNIIILMGIYLCSQSHLNRAHYIHLGVHTIVTFLITACLDIFKIRQSYWFSKPLGKNK